MPSTLTRTLTLEEAERLLTESAFRITENGRDRLVLHTRRGGFGADNDLRPLLAELRHAETIIHRDGIFGPVVFAAFPGNRGVSIDVDTGP